MSQLWGEFENPEPKDTVPAEIIKYIIMQAMQQDPLRTPPPNEKPIVKGDPEVDFSDTRGLDIDDRVVHSVQLIQVVLILYKIHSKIQYFQYSRDMRALIEEGNTLGTDAQVTTIPELPEHPVPPLKHQFNYPLQFMDKDYR